MRRTWCGALGINRQAASPAHRAGLLFCLRPTLDLYTTEGEAVPNETGSRRTRATGIAIEVPCTRGGGSRGRPVVSVGGLIVRLPIGVVTMPRRGEERGISFAVPGQDCQPAGIIVPSRGRRPTKPLPEAGVGGGSDLTTKEPPKKREGKVVYTTFPPSPLWCPGQESNLHASRHTHLKRARLPIPPPGH